MRTEFEQSDIQAIAQEVIQAIKPLLAKGKAEDDTVFDVKGLAVYLKVTAKWIYERTHLKEIPHYKVMGKLLFKKKDIDKWLATYKVPAVNTLAKNFQLIKQR